MREALHRFEINALMAGRSASAAQAVRLLGMWSAVVINAKDIVCIYDWGMSCT